MLAKEWLNNARGVMDKIENTQMENIRKAAEAMADSIEAGRWVHTFGCGHVHNQRCEPISLPRYYQPLLLPLCGYFPSGCFQFCPLHPWRY